MAKKGYIQMTNGEKIEFELYPNEAPGTVANFEKLANEAFIMALISTESSLVLYHRGDAQMEPGRVDQATQSSVRRKEILISMRQVPCPWHTQEKIQAAASSLLSMSRSPI